MKEKHQLHLDGRLIAESDGAVWVPLADPTQYAIALHYEKKVPLLEGDIQSALTFRKHVAHTPQLSGAAFATCLPCIHVTIAGSYIRFSASMLGEELFVHHYTDYLSLAGPGDLQYIRRRVDHISKHFDVVREALQSLRQYYKGVQPRSRDTKDPARLRPNPTLRPTSTRSSHTRLEGLVFEDRMSFGDMQYNPALWRARYRGRPALVKFTERYSVRTHQLLAGCSPPKAPELYFAEKIVGGIWMIVMKRLKETNAENTFLDQALPSSVVNDVKAALDVLHKGGLVFGDLRRSNIMVQLENDVYRAKLIDFDNSGREVASDDPAAAEYEAGGPWYDPFLNPWPGLPQEIQPSKPMRAAHDLAMLELISPSDRLGLNEQGQVFWSK
ncbi:hypothetical protein BOTBODRAFT_59154 [Botryobasidium botryosum FD-172 SS1]|uniref:Protein kinase domain-containing protein n=1 Tax=Botryobasidium botryosum (strain FD-172 SS1) TaxID=930990 RepID=A0A067LZW2_BOTB1|nr:hypothetical protein BOTBODRAFT_59154 [Botryobasidium botryosum FD-172 SS1]